MNFLTQAAGHPARVSDRVTFTARPGHRPAPDLIPKCHMPGRISHLRFGGEIELYPRRMLNKPPAMGNRDEQIYRLRSPLVAAKSGLGTRPGLSKR